MRQNAPYFSIIIRTKNVEKTITRCLDSIYNQDFKNFEIVLVEHGSTDKTVKIIKTQFPKVKIFNRAKVSLATLRKEGVKAAKGEYIFFVDADQTLSEGLLKECQELIQSQKNSSKKMTLEAITIPERPREVNSYLQKVIWYERELMEKAGRGLPRIYLRKFYQKINADSETLFIGEDKVAFDLAKKNKVNHTMSSKFIFHEDFKTLLPLLKKYIQYGKTIHLLADKNNMYTDKSIVFFVELFKLIFLRAKPIIALSVFALKLIKASMLKWGEWRANKTKQKN